MERLAEAMQSVDVPVVFCRPAVFQLATPSLRLGSGVDLFFLCFQGVPQLFGKCACLLAITRGVLLVCLLARLAVGGLHAKQQATL
jgi:hypothetical protein